MALSCKAFLLKRKQVKRKVKKKVRFSDDCQQRVIENYCIFLLHIWVLCRIYYIVYYTDISWTASTSTITDQRQPTVSKCELGLGSASSLGIFTAFCYHTAYYRKVMMVPWCITVCSLMLGTAQRIITSIAKCPGRGFLVPDVLCQTTVAKAGPRKPRNPDVMDLITFRSRDPDKLDFLPRIKPQFRDTLEEAFQIGLATARAACAPIEPVKSMSFHTLTCDLELFLQIPFD
jgi:hypothetical protein